VQVEHQETQAKGAAPKWWIEVLVVIVFLGLIAIFWPDLAARLRIQTSVLTHCPLPGEHEQLHLVFARRGDQFELIDCMYVGSRGTYSRDGAR